MDDADFEKVAKFIAAAEALLQGEKFSLKSAYDSWEDWEDDDPDKIELLRMRRAMAYNEEVEEKDIDGRILAYEYLRAKYASGLSLTKLTAQVLIDNCCDPHLDYLEFHPSIYHLHVAPEQ